MVLVSVSAFIGALVSYVMAYPLILLAGIGTGIVFAIAGAQFGDGIDYLVQLASNAASEQSEWNPWSWYGTFLVVVNAVAVFVGARVAGALATGFEYWAALATIPLLWGITSIFADYPAHGTMWWVIVSEGLAVFSAIVGGYFARRANL